MSEKPNYLKVLEDATNAICELGDAFACNQFISTIIDPDTGVAEAGPYAVIHFMDDCDVALALKTVQDNFGTLLDFYAQDAYTITVWNK